MTVRIHPPRRSATTALLVCAALAATSVACGNQRDDRGAAGKPKGTVAGAPLSDLLPADIRSAGVIRVGSDIAYPPVEFKDASGRTVGLDVDIARAMGEQLGVELRFQNGTFDTLVTGLRADRYDILMSAMNDTKDRQNGVDPVTGKKVGEGLDFVDYFNAGVSLYARKQHAGTAKGWDDLCGRTVAVQRGAVAHNLLKTEDAECARSGRPAIDIEAFDTDAEAQMRVRSNGADFGSSDFPAAAYAVKTSGGGEDLALVGEQTGALPYGIAVEKKDTRLRDALAAALDAIIANGQYGDILAKWGSQDGAVTKAVVNGGA
ncbi:ABC transporter substrate-binding protein [Streptomyces sp. NPDC006339]|uniref:ABC transporter substrate-binding protein n=1 Tax=Streptomyces sp. NPDC006339 TaxID=3156755 RepID=UPI0033B726BF